MTLVVEFISTTNNKFHWMQKTIGKLTVTQGYSAIFATFRGILYTSNVVSIKERRDYIILKTLNSTYKFRKVKDD